MGLRFRKSVSLFPGVKLNFGTTGMSVSTGIPGFRKTFHTSGRVTTSVGIPGTGIYYVDTKDTKKQSDRRTSRTRSSRSTDSSLNQRHDASAGSQASYDVWDAYSSANDKPDCITHTPVNQVEFSTEHESTPEEVQLDATSLKSIHKSSDDSIDWTEVLVTPLPPDETFNQAMWQYYHAMAPKVLSGDIDTYLQLICEVNPLNDLLAYGGNFEFGTDNPSKIEVEFTVNENALSSVKRQLISTAYNNLLQDYICSVCIRIARDMFALLPVTHTLVHAVLSGNTVISVDFDRENLSKVKFGYGDPSDTLSLFKHNMNYNDRSGFAPVAVLE